MQFDDMDKINQELAAAEQREKRRGETAAEAYEWAESLIMAFVVILLVFTFLTRNATVFGASMEPTLHEGDQLMLQQIGYHDPQYGDVVVIDRSQSSDDPLVKRVIGKPGDMIYINFENGEVWRNDELLDEPYINEPTLTGFDVQFPVKVPEHHVFVMGDNRNHSSDSRMGSIGMVEYNRIMGKVVLRFFPLSKIGVVE